MSLAIDVDNVTDVLLADGKWYVVDDASFSIDAYEFLWKEGLGEFEVLHGSGTGFQFMSGNARFSGPMSAVYAVKEATRKGPTIKR